MLQETEGDCIDECDRVCTDTVSNTSITENPNEGAACGITKKSKKRKGDDELTSIAMQCLAEMKSMGKDENLDKGRKDMSDDEKYGVHVAAEMSKISDELTKQHVKAEIQQLFLKAHSGYYKQTRSLHMNQNIEQPNRFNNYPWKLPNHQPSQRYTYPQSMASQPFGASIVHGSANPNYYLDKPQNTNAGNAREVQGQHWSQSHSYESNHFPQWNQRIDGRDACSGPVFQAPTCSTVNGEFQESSGIRVDRVELCNIETGECQSNGTSHESSFSDVVVHAMTFM